MDNQKNDQKPPQKQPLKQEEKKDEAIEKIRQECEDYKNKYLRALADYQNLERRMRTEKDEVYRSAQARVILQILPVVDTLDQAEVFVKDPGLKMVKDRFVQQLTEMGIKAIDMLHKEFDPYTAEAIEVVDGDKDNIVIEVLRNGYMFHDKVLRPAQVKVSKQKSL